MQLTGQYRAFKRVYLHEYKCKYCKQDKTLLSRSKHITHSGVCSSCHCKKTFNKPIILTNYKKNITERHPSITSFCIAHPELGKNAKFHFSEVLKGKRVHYKGWHSKKNILPQCNK